MHPSAIEVVPGTDHLLILSSGPAALLEIDGNGVPQGQLRLPRRHAQPEGLAIAANGDIFISDEGGNGGGTLAIYRCHPYRRWRGTAAPRYDIGAMPSRVWPEW